MGAGEGETLLGRKAAFPEGVGKISIGVPRPQFRTGPRGQPGRGGWGFKECGMREAGTEVEVALDLGWRGWGDSYLQITAEETAEGRVPFLFVQETRGLEGREGTVSSPASFPPVVHLGHVSLLTQRNSSQGSLWCPWG